MQSVQFSHSVVSDSLQPHGLQQASSSPTPRVYSKSCPSHQWCHPTIWFSVIPSSFCLQLSQHQGLSKESVLCITWPKYWSFIFNISTSNEYLGLISFRMDWLDLLAVQGILKSLSNTTVQKHQFFSAQLSSTITSIHDYWKNHTLD